METATMQDKKAMHPNDLKESKSCSEKFLQAWRENQKLQSCPVLSQESKCLSAIENPTQDKSPSHNLTRASLQPSENALYFLTVNPTSQGQPQSESWITGHCSQQLPIISWQQEPNPVEQEPTSIPLDDEEEFYEICVSDLLMDSSVKKRPRLLPPDIKMYMEVKKTQKWYPLQEGQVDPPVESLSPPEDKKASNYQNAIRKPAKLRFKQHQQLSQKRNASPSDSEMVQQPVKLPQNSHLPPKKQYMQAWLEETRCNMGNAL